MAQVTIPHDDRGVALFEEMDSYVNKYLLAGDQPRLEKPINLPLANNRSLAQYSVVGIDGAGKLAMATFDATVKASFVLPHAAVLGATGTANAPAWYSGCFNIDALVWDASFDTDAKKEAAFRGALSPTQIVALKRGVDA